jgi:hypothetical protein
MSVCRRVFLVGASGTGKSTVAKQLAAAMDLPYCPISAQEGYRHHGTTVEEAFRDPALMEKCQAHVRRHTHKRMEELVALPFGFVTDRAYDLSVYASLLGCPHSKESVRRIVELMTAPPTVGNRLAVSVIFFRPHRDVLCVARATDGSRRNQFLTDEWVYRVDGALAHHVRFNGIPHDELPEHVVNVADRVAWCEALVRTNTGKNTRFGRLELPVVDGDGCTW